MKKKILVTLSLACMAAFSLGVSACDKPEDTEKPAQHSHNYQWVDNGNGTHKQHCAVEGCDAPDISSGDHDFTKGDCVCGAQKPAGHVHTPLEAVKENIVQPTLESEGGYDLVVRCSECGEVISTEHVNLGKLELTGTEITSKTLNKEGDRLYAKLPNGTETFRFAGDITVAEGASWLLCTDILGTQVIPTKIAPLQTGDNTFYLVVTNGNSDPMTYTVTLRVRPFYTVTFDANGGNTVPSQQIEEDDTLEELTADGKTGYTFSHWEVNEERVTFPYTVTGNTTLTAEYTANTYTVTLDVNGGDELNKTEYETVYDSAFTLATPTRTGYTFDGWYDGANKITDTEWKYTEDKTFTARWSINSYEIALQKEITTAGAVTGAGAYNYGTQATVTAETYIGYDFLGWYDGSALVSEELSFTVTVGAQNKTYTAKWAVKDEYSAFNFTSTASTANITGIKDKTVTELVIPDGVTSIGMYAFRDCDSLESLTVPDSLTSIGDSAFSSDSSLASIYYKGDIAGWCGIFGLNRFMVYADSNKKLYIDGKEITGELIIPEGVMGIGSCAFYGCSGVTSVIIPDSVTSIKERAFTGCPIETATIPALAANYVGNGKLKTVVITSGNSIADEAFYLCESLTSITIPDSVTSIGERVFNGCLIETATIPALAVGHFVKSNLETVIITSGNSIENNAFEDCISLKSVTIGNSVKTIGHYAFKGCSSLTNIIIGDGVTDIDYLAFNGCKNLTSITIPDSVKSIGNSVFGGCYGLTIYCEATEKPSGWNSLNCPVVWDCKNNDKDENGYAYSIIGGVRYQLKDGAATVCRQPEIINGDIVIPASVTYKNAEYGVTTIVGDAFRDCGNLTSITIPDSVTAIVEVAFVNCDGLIIYCEASEKPSDWHDDWNYDCPVVWDCKNNDKDSNGYAYSVTDGVCYRLKDSIATVYKQAKTISGDITILASVIYKNAEYSVTSIAKKAFYHCSGLTSITIPDSVTTIGDYVFYNCSGLKGINFNGKKEQWNAITKDSEWNASTGNYTIHCTDGDMAKN